MRASSSFPAPFFAVDAAFLGLAAAFLAGAFADDLEVDPFAAEDAFLADAADVLVAVFLA